MPEEGPPAPPGRCGTRRPGTVTGAGPAARPVAPIPGGRARGAATAHGPAPRASGTGAHGRQTASFSMISSLTS